MIVYCLMDVDNPYYSSLYLMLMVENLSHTPKSDDFLRQLAMDWLDGRVFTSYRLSNDEIMQVFPILLLMNKDQRTTMIAEDVCMIYEYLTEAGPYTVNGNPAFLSANVLTRNETFRLGQWVGKYSKLKKGFLGVNEKENGKEKKEKKP